MSMICLRTGTNRIYKVSILRLVTCASEHMLIIRMCALVYERA